MANPHISTSNHPRRAPVRIRLAACAAAALVASLTLAACGKTVTASMDDQSITARVRTALLNEPNLAARNIDVQTAQHVVTLSGTVPSTEQRDRAIAVARSSTGVSDVRSDLRIAP